MVRKGGGLEHPAYAPYRNVKRHKMPSVLIKYNQSVYIGKLYTPILLRLYNNISK